jgi:hypothetical protein
MTGPDPPVEISAVRAADESARPPSQAEYRASLTEELDEEVDDLGDVADNHCSFLSDGRICGRWSTALHGQLVNRQQ